MWQSNKQNMLQISIGLILIKKTLHFVNKLYWTGFQEEEEWEKVRQIDNPILPWSVKYAPDVGAHNMGHGRPHFYTVSTDI